MATDIAEVTDEVTWEREPDPSDSLRTFGAVLHVLREHAGLSRAELSEIVRFSVHTVASVELGLRMADEALVERVEEATGTGSSLNPAVVKINAVSGVDRVEQGREFGWWFLITITPRSCGAVSGCARSSSRRPSLTAAASQVDSDRKNCSCCTTGAPAPTTGSAPAKHVMVLFRSRGASSPVRYSRKPRRWARLVNRTWRAVHAHVDLRRV